MSFQSIPSIPPPNHGYFAVEHKHKMLTLKYPNDTGLEKFWLHET